MALTEAQKASVRRHLDYPVAGLMQNSPAGGSLASAFVGYRFFQSYGRLEWKLNSLSPVEEAMLFGKGYGAVALVGPNPNPGDTISITLSGGNIATPQTISATAPAFAAGSDGRVPFINTLAANAARNTALQTAGVLAISPFGTGPFNENQVPLAEVGFVSPVAFTLASPTGSGTLVPQVTADGAVLPPVASLDGTTNINGYIPILDGLEGAWAGASQNLDTIQAGPWKARNNEAGQRTSLYVNWQIHLSRFLEIPIYVGPGTGNQRPDYRGNMRFS